MKILLIVNLVFAGLLVACGWFFKLFAYGVFINPVGLFLAGFCGFVVFMPLFLSVPVMFAANIYSVFKYWTKHKLITLVPFLTLGVAVVSLFALDEGEMSIRRFKKYLPDYEAFVKMAEKKHKPGDWDRMRLPEGYKHLGYVANIYEDKPVSNNEPNTLFVSILVGSRGFCGHTYFFCIHQTVKLLPA